MSKASPDMTLCAIRIFSPEIASDLVDRAEAGDREASVWMSAIEDWFKVKMSKHKQWRCPGCHTAFEDFSEIGAFVVVIPEEEYDRCKHGQGLGSVFCSQCVASGKDLNQIVVESLQGRSIEPRDFN